jgi:hypothetical protein
MNTAEINAARLHTIRGPVATALVAITRNRLRNYPRVIAIGRSVAGSGLVITTGEIPAWGVRLKYSEFPV